MPILQINWSADAGKGRSMGGAHSHQSPCLSTFDKQFLLKCLFFRSTGAQTQAKGAARVAHSHQPPCLSTFDKQFLLICLFFRSTGAQTQAKGAARVAHTPTNPLVTRPVVTADPGSKVTRASIGLRFFYPCPRRFLIKPCFYISPPVVPYQDLVT